MATSIETMKAVGMNDQEIEILTTPIKEFAKGFCATRGFPILEKLFDLIELENKVYEASKPPVDMFQKADVMVRVRDGNTPAASEF